MSLLTNSWPHLHSDRVELSSSSLEVTYDKNDETFCSFWLSRSKLRYKQVATKISNNYDTDPIGSKFFLQ